MQEAELPGLASDYIIESLEREIDEELDRLAAEGRELHPAALTPNLFQGAIRVHSCRGAHEGRPYRGQGCGGEAISALGRNLSPSAARSGF